MEDYKKLADDLRWQADYHRLNRETARRSAGAIENLMIENAALLQIAEKQATMNVTLTNNVLAMDKELHEAKSELQAAVRDRETLQKELAECKADRDAAVDLIKKWERYRSFLFFHGFVTPDEWHGQKRKA